MEVAKAALDTRVQEAVWEAVRKQELDNLSATLQGWREQLQERAIKLAVAEVELEDDSKSLDRLESQTAYMEKLLGRQRDSLKKQKESVEKKKAELEERSREVEAAKAALDTRVHGAVQEAVRKLQEDQRGGPANR